MKLLEQLVDRADRFFEQGAWQEAESGYLQVLQIDPPNAYSNHRLGVIAIRLDDGAKAMVFLEKALAYVPNHPHYMQSLAMALAMSNQLDRAVALMQQATRLAPEIADFHLQLGQLLAATGKNEAAVDSFCRACELGSDRLEELQLFTHDRLLRGGTTYSILPVLRYLAQRLRSPEAFNELGYALQVLNDSRQSIDAFKQAIQLRPNYASALNNLGTAYRKLGLLDEARDSFQRAIQADSSIAEAHVNLGIALTDICELDMASLCYQRAIALRPSYEHAYSRYLFNLQYQPGVTEKGLLESHVAFGQRFCGPAASEGDSKRRRHVPSTPLRVGFVSDGLGQHPVGRFLSSFLSHGDPSLITFTMYCDRNRNDSLTHALRQSSGVWRETSAMSHDTLARTILEDQIDVLFDLDGHAGRRMGMYSRRPAPIQCTWMGYVGTTGLASMDYLVADRWQIPATSEAYYLEKVIRMPDGYVCFPPPADSEGISPLPMLQNGYVTFGSMNQPAKANLQVLHSWARILRGVPKSRLRLQYKGYDCSSIIARIRNVFREYSIDEERLEFVGKSSGLEMLTGYQSIDIALDTFPYSGGITTCEALWMGVPVVTLPGDTFASRHATSHLSNVGMSELIATNLDAYEALAIDLANSSQRLELWRDRLRAQMLASPLCDGERFARGWTNMIQRMSRDSV